MKYGEILNQIYDESLIVYKLLMTNYPELRDAPCRDTLFLLFIVTLCYWDISPWRILEYFPG